MVPRPGTVSLVRDPKVHAHLSAFSFPWLSYHALRKGLDAASATSWANTDIMLCVGMSREGDVWSARNLMVQPEHDKMPTHEYTNCTPEYVK